MKYRLFIGSSTESIKYAESVQLMLSKIDNLEAICWTTIFKTGHYTLEDLLGELNTMTFGVFILAPDDLLQLRGKDYNCTRDNVILELGMYYGALGRNRTFFIAPNDTDGTLRLPSDLKGLTYSTYTLVDADAPDGAVFAACTEIKRAINSQIKTIEITDTVDKYGVFPDFDYLYKDLFASATNITTFFIHSYRWRETNIIPINKFLERNDVHWNVILPDISNRNLLAQLKKHFADGKQMVSKVNDAYEYFTGLAKKHPGKLSIRLFNLYPTYTFYKFDNKVIVSLYPLTPERRPTPTFLIDITKRNNDFFVQDIADIIKASRPMSAEEMDEIINPKKN